MRVGKGGGHGVPAARRAGPGKSAPRRMSAFPRSFLWGPQGRFRLAQQCGVTWQGVLDGRGRTLTLPGPRPDPCTQVPHLPRPPWPPYSAMSEKAKPHLGRCFTPGRGASGLLWVREERHQEPPVNAPQPHTSSFPPSGVYAKGHCNRVSGRVTESTIPAFTEGGTGDFRAASLGVGLSWLLIGGMGAREPWPCKSLS